MALSFLARFSTEYGTPARAFEPGAERAMTDYHWPGNVRELQNVIERAAILCSAERVPASLLSLESGPGAPAGDGMGTPPRLGADISLEQLERRHIEAVLARADTLDEAARILDIDASTLYRKRKTFGLS
jgi:NtrC-family two-component system response regulator AlgB